MNPADLTLPTVSPSLVNKSLPSLAAAHKNGKVSVPRVDLESIYVQLKAALGDHWGDYKTAINAFVLGNLSQSELEWVLQPLLSPTASIAAINDATKPLVSTLYLHNSLLIALYANLLRDAPPTDVAPWVAATDKPTSSSKNAGAGGANDQTEERLKRETMALHARDRRRIKTVKEKATVVNDGLREVQEYAQELAARAPDTNPQAGPMGKSAWDLESRRRYAQPLASEMLEFPAQSDVQNRIEPICNEEGLAAGAQATVQACAELVEQATEVFLKEMLGHLCSHSRSNGEGLVRTTRYKRQLYKEEHDVERGAIQRNATGMLPVEMEAHAKRRPMDMTDLRLALQLQDSYLRQDPFLSEHSLFQRFPSFATESTEANGFLTQVGSAAVNGTLTKAEHDDAEDAMAVDDEDYWTCATTADRDGLLGVLDDCLAVG